MIKIRIIEHYGDVVYSYRNDTFETKNEYWMACGKRFDKEPTPEEVELAYA